MVDNHLHNTVDGERWVRGERERNNGSGKKEREDMVTKIMLGSNTLISQASARK